MADAEPFSSEYVTPGDSVIAPRASNVATTNAAMLNSEQEIQSQAEQHGTSKPRRVTINAEICHD
ncbi:hypothetical protein LOC68_13275 [Blastopirellula sp. JC732]|uniref:Uncharacterized protein n=1 Tax=Blastopirellula sediminis TaxID=2894196 RepID=A0A9X1SGU9_9BACT|nr:hypothetical protein [Blastopirellula sediminis]MCC9607340.1 hypothetical protein [Blastopirellula sediminis]MCC9629367.1 hypothetical protein [Blastopirellula sediminis]